ncbi:MAG TPA: hypothetical protein VHA82_13525 [Ramlibacter sp.]|uniref:hypothetical protein n=1 Tax=Ramlibacter sp. TaxID=1917967 RepID=UPI002CC72DFC|nr:hypothetical protein [Ramlibacter sp.]HVZ44825.1 hypothetical protein [Ramlibacter sp.]
MVALFALRRSKGLNPFAGVIAGAVAGAAYLVAQMIFAATVLGGEGAEPLQRIGAILLGPDELPPPAEFSARIIGIALLIHFGLAIVFGRIIDGAVRGLDGFAALATGACAGVVLYVIDYWVIAPVAFPWFLDSRGPTTFLDHVLFGVVAAAVYVALRGKFPVKA